MATHASDRGGALIPGHRGGKRLTMMVIMFVGHLVLGDEPNIVSALGPHVIWLEVFMFMDKGTKCNVGYSMKVRLGVPSKDFFPSGSFPLKRYHPLSPLQERVFSSTFLP